MLPGNMATCLFCCVIALCCSSCDQGSPQGRSRRKTRGDAGKASAATRRESIPVENWSYTILGPGNSLIAHSEDLARFVEGGSERWVEGLKDDRFLDDVLLESMENEVDVARFKQQVPRWNQGDTAPGAPYRVCDLFFLQYCNSHPGVETPKWTDFSSLSMRDRKIKTLISRLQRSCKQDSPAHLSNKADVAAQKQSLTRVDLRDQSAVVILPITTLFRKTLWWPHEL